MPHPQSQLAKQLADVTHRVMHPHQSHESIIKSKVLTPQELGRLKRETEEKRLIDLQRRRQMEVKMRMAQAAQAQAQAQGTQVTLHGAPVGALPGMGNPQMNGGPAQMAMRGPGGVPNISQQGNAALIAAAQRGAAGDMTNPVNSAMLLLQQQQNQQRLNAAAAMANGTPPRPQSAASILSQGAMAGTPPQPQMLTHPGMQNPNFRMHPSALAAQMSQIPGVSADAVSNQTDS
jgi:hypothetical protein